MKTYVIKVEPFTKFVDPKAKALKPLEEAERKVKQHNVERGRYDPY